VIVFNFKTIGTLVVSVLCLLPVAGNAQNESSEGTRTSENFVFVMQLNDDDIASLRKTGMLKGRVPEKMVNRISAIRLQRKNSFVSDSMKCESTSERVGQTISVGVDESVIQRLEYQPVQIPVYNSAFTNVLLKHSYQQDLIEKTRAELPPPEAGDSPQMLVSIDENRAVIGYLKGLSKFKITTEFGDVEVPAENVRGIKFNTGESQDKAFMVLSAGDAITGVFKNENVTVGSRWGEKDLKVKDLNWITHAINLKFVPDSKNEGRWLLEVIDIPQTAIDPIEPALDRATSPELNSIDK
jgi:hypothetical protein